MSEKSNSAEAAKTDPNQPSKDILRVANSYYVLATSVLAEHDTRILKHGETFAVFDSYGDVLPITHPESGIYHHGTRHVSRFEVQIDGIERRPLILNSTLRDDNGLLKIDMTNPDLGYGTDAFIAKGDLYIHREKFLLEANCIEQVSVVNYSDREIEIGLSLRVEADFADIFEVRGTKRARRGTSSAPRHVGNAVIFEYTGLDSVQRTTCLRVTGVDFECPSQEPERLRIRMKVPARSRQKIQVDIGFRQEAESIQSAADFSQGLKYIHANHSSGRKRFCTIRSSNDRFDLWMRRSTDDLVMMITKTEGGFQYPYAGIPWFCTPFGRDGIITAMECLWANPRLAAGVLDFLAHTQADEHVPESDATPGKIVHEVREGEMASLKEIPFGRYYGSVDSTPLFVALAGMYLSRTNDIELIRTLWPQIEKALFWIDRYGDLDGDGFVEYQSESPNGLVQQGWKDSRDSVFHADRSLAKGPIALCEVQGYCYMAKIEGAKMAEAIGHADLALELRKKAADLKEKFDSAFWRDDIGSYAMALDGDKKPCVVRSSNAGQCLFTGIVKENRAAVLAKTLMSPALFSGWGIRTIATGESRFNPMSYHNGTVWPHDTALIAWGLCKYGFMEAVDKIFCGLFHAAGYLELFRMPEVFCGFERREGEAPTLYPNACAPQAWAAASIYLMLQSMLGLSVDAKTKSLRFSFPRLPKFIETMTLIDLPVGEDTVDAVIQNYDGDVVVRLSKRGEGITMTVEK